MNNIFLDTETCGLHGVPVLLQYAQDDGPITCYDLWLEPIDKTIELLLTLSKHNIIGFNLVFDWFHIYKFFTMLVRFIQEYPELSQDRPYDHVEKLASLERDAATVGCLRPPAACDVMLISKLGPYQSLMDRKDIYIRRVPALLAEALQSELEKRVHIDDIYFSRRKVFKDAPRWTITPSKDKETNKVMRGFFDLTLRFKPSGALKVLAQHALKIPLHQIIQRADVLPEARPEKDLGYCPVGGDWPKYVKTHAVHWKYNERARTYATDDVTYTRGLWGHFGSPEPGDIDSNLAIMVACVRWRGLAVQVDKMQNLIDLITPELKGTPQAPNAVQRWVGEVMDEEMRTWFVDTKKQTLQGIAKTECDCAYAREDPVNCPICSGTGKHPAAIRAERVLTARMEKKELELYEKIVQAGRLYPSYRVIGTLSGRMSGADRLNVMGIKRVDSVRALFKLADPNEVVVGGDFDAFEVVLAIADSGDQKLAADVQKGLKIHALFACEMFPGVTYDQVRASAGTANDMYTLGKNGVFTMIYGGDENTLVNKYGVEETQAKLAFDGFDRKYPDLAKWRKQTQQQFQLISQERLGSKIEVGDASEYVDSMFGYKRYFTLELQIIRALVELAEKPPEDWKKIKVKVLRRADRGQQTVGNAVRSALYGAAFSVQSAVQRAASNHRIQAAGARVTKVVQHTIWTKYQPIGFAPWTVRPINIHDEVIVVTQSKLTAEVQQTVADTVESFRDKVPLLKLGWGPMTSWSKGVSEETAQTVLDSTEPIEVLQKQTGLTGEKIMAIKSRRDWRWLVGSA